MREGGILQMVEDRTCRVIAEVFDVPPANVTPATALCLGDLGWKGFLEMALELEREFGITLPIEVPNTWTTVADAVAAVVNAIEAASAAEQGRAA